jgi:hypothetical protein
MAETPPLAGEDVRREIRQRLTLENLERHLHDYHNFGDETTFISLSVGCVERETFLGTNLAHPARVTALEFATRRAQITGYLFICWVIIAMNPAHRGRGPRRGGPRAEHLPPALGVATRG